MAWKRIKGVRDYTVSKEDGTFQAELSGNEELYIEGDGLRCDLNIPVFEEAEYIINLGDLICDVQ